MRRFVPLVLALLYPATALADGFGGFARDGSHYLVGADRVCVVATGGAAPACAKATDVASYGFKKGKPLGQGDRFQAQVAGAKIKIVSLKDGSKVTEWEAADPIGGVTAMYLSADASLLAIEFTTRFGGRTVSDAVVVTVGKPASAEAGADPGRGGGEHPATGQAQADPGTVSAADPKALARALASADKLFARKKWLKAEAAYRAVLVLDADAVAAHYGIAACLARQKQADKAVAELELIAASRRQDAPVWLVEARTATAFAALRDQGGFRRAVGLERDPTRPRSAYERLVGLGGTWEQAAVACKEPGVGLVLDRKKRSFALEIKTRCQGDDDTTRLGGTWAAVGTSSLELTFPNQDGPDETLTCGLDACADDASEDCLACTLEDTSFTLRLVRR